jgi:hypothetical protein
MYSATAYSFKKRQKLMGFKIKRLTSKCTGTVLGVEDIKLIVIGNPTSRMKSHQIVGIYNR